MIRNSTKQNRNSCVGGGSGSGSSGCFGNSSSSTILNAVLFSLSYYVFWWNANRNYTNILVAKNMELLNMTTTTAVQAAAATETTAKPTKAATTKPTKAATAKPTKEATTKPTRAANTITNDPVAVVSSNSSKYNKPSFFQEISDTDWDLMRTHARQMQPNYVGNFNTPGEWYQTNYEPDYSCLHERRIGRAGDGGKWVCDPHKIRQRKDDDSATKSATDDGCLVYSVGSKGEFSFERGIQQELGRDCEIHTFDMIDYTSSAQRGVQFHAWGLSNVSKNVGGQVFKTLQETVLELGHTNRTIDVFKIDCEGCEWEAAASWFDADVRIQQIQVEVHKVVREQRGVTVESGQQVVSSSSKSFFDRMYQEGYTIFHKEPNIQFWFGFALEYAFVYVGKEFLFGGDKSAAK